MGNRRATDASTMGIGAGTATSAVGVATMVLAFVLEVAMIAAFLFWGFKQAGPWNLVLGIGVPAVVAVFWGAFMAPRSERRLPEKAVGGVSLGLFLAAAVALLSVGSTMLGVLMALVSVAQFAASRFVDGRR
ncbi:YrdB family protein [Arthrobacter sp. LAPM80]|uniref:YrdB family protein n=1 Tax=Arthrobacter sp. LAPM80 TaxID=3141788 RepID=UPI00398B2224